MPYNYGMNTKVTLPKPRNWVAKNDRNRAARHRDQTQYQRHSKHRYRGLASTNLAQVDQ